MACRFAFRSKIGPLIINMLHGSFLREMARMMRAAAGTRRRGRPRYFVTGPYLVAEGATHGFASGDLRPGHHWAYESQGRRPVM